MCHVVEERHFAVNIQKWILEALELYGITEKQLLSFTIDSAANMTKAVDDFIKSSEAAQEEDKNFEKVDELTNNSEIITEINEDEDLLTDQYEAEVDFSDVALPTTRIHCAAHRLQLGVNDFLRQRPYSTVVAIAQKLSSKLRTPIARTLLKIEGLKAPVMFQETRWSSTLKLLERVIELETFIKNHQNLYKG